VLKKIKEGLSKTRNSILSGLKTLLSFNKEISEEFIDELETLLITADIGVNTVTKIIDKLRTAHKKGEIKIEKKEDLFNFVENEIRTIFSDVNNIKLNLEPKPAVILVLGVNGSGKTTTIGKLANKFKEEGKKVIVAAADTFRAAAIEQLEVWAKRANVQLIKQMANSDPSAVVYDAINSAIAKKIDIVIIDTAGRLHTKSNLIEELKKIKKVIEKILPHPINEILLVFDATTGQNAINQAKIFNEAIGITGIVLTKIDGTAKGGIIIPIKQELNIPVKLVGTGEKIDDLDEFNIDEYVKSLFED